MIKGSCGAFDYFIENQFPEDVVVMGHTHEPVAEMQVLFLHLLLLLPLSGFPSLRYFRNGEKAARLGSQIAYINSGAWVTNGTFTYVDTIYEYARIYLHQVSFFFWLIFFFCPAIILSAHIRRASFSTNTPPTVPLNAMLYVIVASSPRHYYVTHLSSVVALQSLV